MSLNGVSIAGPTATGFSPATRQREPTSQEADRSAMPYVSPVLRIDVDQGGPVMAYRDRQTGEVTEQRAARLESARKSDGNVEPPSDRRDNGDDQISGGPTPASRERLETANSAYQQTAKNAAGTAEPARPTTLSFEA